MKNYQLFRHKFSEPETNDNLSEHSIKGFPTKDNDDKLDEILNT